MSRHILARCLSGLLTQPAQLSIYFFFAANLAQVKLVMPIFHLWRLKLC